MNRAVVAMLVSVSLLGGCFPHNPKARTYAKIGEGTALIAGIAISAFANTSADCDQMTVSGLNQGEANCRSGAQWASAAGVALIVGGLLGFVATVSTAEDEEKPKAVEIKEVAPSKPEAKPEAKPEPAAPAPEQTGNTQATEANESAGSGSGAPSAPQR
jgi:hypothetical protein